MNNLRSDGGVFIFLPGRWARITQAWRSTDRLWSLFPSKRHITIGATLVDAGQLRAVVQQRFTLEDVADALTVSAKGHVVGKLGIDIEQSGVKCDAWLGGTALVCGRCGRPAVVGYVAAAYALPVARYVYRIYYLLQATGTAVL